MKDSQEYILIRSLELRHSPWISEMDNPNQLQDRGIHRSFIIQFNDSFDRISMLIHLKHLSILKLTFITEKRVLKTEKIKNNICKK